MIRIHNNEVNNIYEFNLLHDIINHPKRAKYLNNHYSHNLHGCINTRKLEAKFKNFAYYWTVYVVPRLQWEG